MAFKKNANDLSGLLLLVVSFLPFIAAYIDCNGKPFHCVNTTHFMICVDLGRGVSSTIDDFIIPCPPTTECLGNNRFECEFPAVTTTTTTTVAPATLLIETAYSETVRVEMTSMTTAIPFGENFNTISSTTLSDFTVSAQSAIETEPARTVSDFTENIDVITTLNDNFPNELVEVVQSDFPKLDKPTTNKFKESVTNSTGSLNVLEAEFNSNSNQTVQTVSVEVRNDTSYNTQSITDLLGNIVSESVLRNGIKSEFNSTLSKAIPNNSAYTIQYEMTTLAAPSGIDYFSTVKTESLLLGVTESLSVDKQESEYKSTSNQTISIASDTVKNETNVFKQNKTISRKIDYVFTNSTETNVIRLEFNPILNDTISSVSVDAVQYESTTLFTPINEDLPITIATDSKITDITGILSVLEQETENNSILSHFIPIVSNDLQIGITVNKRNSSLPNKIDNNTVTNSFAINVTQFEIDPTLSVADTNFSVDAVQLKTLVATNSTDFSNNIETNSILTDVTENLSKIKQESEFPSSQTIPIMSNEMQNDATVHSENSSFLSQIDYDTVTNSIQAESNVKKNNQLEFNSSLSNANQSVSVEVVHHELTTLVTTSSIDFPNNFLTESILKNNTGGINVTERVPGFNSTLNIAAVSNDTAQIPETTLYVPSSMDIPTNLVKDAIETDVTENLKITHESEYNSTLSETIPVVYNGVQNDTTKKNQSDFFLASKIHNIETEWILTNRTKVFPSVPFDVTQNGVTTLVTPSSTDFPINAIGEDVSARSETFKHEIEPSAILNKIDNDTVTNSFAINVTQFKIDPTLSKVNTNFSVDAVQPKTLIAKNSTDFSSNIGTDSILTDVTGNLSKIKQESEFPSIQTIPIMSNEMQNDATEHIENSSFLSKMDYDTVTNSIQAELNVNKLNQFEFNSSLSNANQSVSVDAVHHELTTLVTTSSIDFPNNIVTESILNNVTAIVNETKRVPGFNSALNIADVSNDTAQIPETTPYVPSSMDIPTNLVKNPIATNVTESLKVTHESENNSTLSETIPVIYNGVQNDTTVRNQSSFFVASKIHNIETELILTNRTKVFPSVPLDVIQNGMDTTLITPSSTDFPINTISEVVTASSDTVEHEIEPNAILINTTVSIDVQNDTILNTQKNVALPIVKNEIESKASQTLKETFPSELVDKVQNEAINNNILHSTELTSNLPEDLAVNIHYKSSSKSIKMAPSTSTVYTLNNTSALSHKKDNLFVTEANVKNVTEPELKLKTSIDVGRKNLTTLFKPNARDFLNNTIKVSTGKDLKENYNVIKEQKSSSINNIQIVADDVANHTTIFTQNSTSALSIDYGDVDTEIILTNFNKPRMKSNFSQAFTIISDDVAKTQEPTPFVPSKGSLNNKVSESISMDVSKSFHMEQPKLNLNSTFMDLISTLSRDKQNETSMNTKNIVLSSEIKDIATELVESVTQTVFDYTSNEDFPSVSFTQNTLKTINNLTSTTIHTKETTEAYLPSFKFQETTTSTVVKENQPVLVATDVPVENISLNSMHVNSSLTKTGITKSNISDDNNIIKYFRNKEITSPIKADYFSISSTTEINKGTSKSNEANTIENIRNTIQETTVSTLESVLSVYDNNIYFHADTENIGNNKDILNNDGKVFSTDPIDNTAATHALNVSDKKNNLTNSSISATDVPVPIYLTPSRSALISTVDSIAINVTTKESPKTSLVPTFILTMENPKGSSYSNSDGQSKIIKQTAKDITVDYTNSKHFSSTNFSTKFSADAPNTADNNTKQDLKTDNITLEQLTLATNLTITLNSTELPKSSVTVDVTKTELPYSTPMVLLPNRSNQSTVVTTLKDVITKTTTEEMSVTQPVLEKLNTVKHSFSQVNYNIIKNMSLIGSNVIKKPDIQHLQSIIAENSETKTGTETVSETINELRENLNNLSIANYPNFSSTDSLTSTFVSTTTEVPKEDTVEPLLLQLVKAQIGIEDTSMKSEIVPNFIPTTINYLSSVNTHQTELPLVANIISDYAIKSPIVENPDSVTNQNSEYTNSVNKVQEEVSVNGEGLDTWTQITNDFIARNANDLFLQTNYDDSLVITTSSQKVSIENFVSTGSVDIPSTESINSLSNLILNSLAIHNDSNISSRPISVNIRPHLDGNVLPTPINKIEETATEQMLKNHNVNNQTNQLNKSGIYSTTENIFSSPATLKSTSNINIIHVSEMTSKPSLAKAKLESTNLKKETSQTEPDVGIQSASLSPIVNFESKETYNHDIVTTSNYDFMLQNGPQSVANTTHLSPQSPKVHFDKMKFSSQQIEPKNSSRTTNNLESKSNVNQVSAKHNSDNTFIKENQIEAPSNTKRLPVIIKDSSTRVTKDAIKHFTTSVSPVEISGPSERTNMIKLTLESLDQPVKLVQNTDSTTVVTNHLENMRKAWIPPEDTKPFIKTESSIANEYNIVQVTSTRPQIVEINMNMLKAHQPELNYSISHLKPEVFHTQNNKTKTNISDADVVIFDIGKSIQQKNNKTFSGISDTLILSKKLIKLGDKSEGAKNATKENLEIQESNNITDFKDSKGIDWVNTKLRQEQNENFDRIGILETAASRIPLNTEISPLDSTIRKPPTKQEEAFESSYKSDINIKLSIVNTATEKAARDNAAVKEPSSTSSQPSVSNASTESKVKSVTITTKSNTTRTTVRYTPTTKSTFVNIHNISATPPTTTNHPNFVCKYRGRYSDDRDCRKFYICIGKPQPIEGKCPNDTVFSETRKQCTKNLSHCYRNDQFQCVSEGRFCDLLKDNIYYICVKNNVGTVIRFKLQCQSGYHLNKSSVRCVLNIESSQTISSNIYTDKSDHNVHSVTSKKLVESIEESSDSSKNNSDQSLYSAKVKEFVMHKPFECKKEGKFSDANNCRKYYICTKISKSRYRKKSMKCDSDEIFHKDKKKCVDADSYECI